MSQNPKVTSKNLSYDSSLPPFLAALRAQAGGGGRGEPSPGGQRRAPKKRSASEEADDIPLVVDEDGNLVNVDVDKEGVVKEGQYLDGDEPEKPSKDGADTAKSATIGGARKRKVGRVVGEAAEDSADKKPEKKDGDDTKEKGNDTSREPDSAKEKKPKKKAKKIKLSFDEDEG